MSQVKEEIATIVHADIVFVRDGVLLECQVVLRYEDVSAQTFCVLIDSDGSTSAIPLRKIMEVAGVERWSELRGQKLMVKHSWERVFELRHITRAGLRYILK